MLTSNQRNIATFILLDIWSTHKVYHYDMLEDFIYMEYGTGENSKKYERFFYNDYVDKFRLSKLKKLRSKIK